MWFFMIFRAIGGVFKGYSKTAEGEDKQAYRERINYERCRAIAGYGHQFGRYHGKRRLRVIVAFVVNMFFILLFMAAGIALLAFFATAMGAQL